MIELIIIFAVAFLVLPLVDILCTTPERTRVVKGIIILFALVCIFILLFGGPVISFPHTWNANPVR